MWSLEANMSAYAHHTIEPKEVEVKLQHKILYLIKMNKSFVTKTIASTDGEH